ncbi:4-(cytidine 5'-diphospho)-2-C-methyl-D-erythritol kinase [Amaricoccus sp.]|uniref:4-(cytidine 5'-diphospho)-2-C-methyl-D-erythritol kinase n=1 Tax=Amaricoccus sp. TaxID=1872485 RepID=UPI002637547B|nr:4-(cytidine 5'-diphospho)-2-C-methyl-D-erythritol kinase [Amaricoccus sp.]HRO10736.1 4-(cytidine 5'-diphospho)-2-C-methyl-D-erythritol kinase [Amaricoccus sp.]
MRRGLHGDAELGAVEVEVERNGHQHGDGDDRDLVEAEPAAGLSLAIGGPFARELSAGPDNLVLRAAWLLAAGRGAAIRLTKSLPVASGIGGGSADAAATLRLLARLWQVELPPPDAVLAIGADLPVCLAGRACRMTGIGEELAPLALPPFWIVLANAGVPLSTAAVFAGLASRSNPPMPDPPALADAAALFDWLAAGRNDLEPPAVAAAPVIRETLAALAAQPGCRLARMSGTGATCFGLFAAEAPALAAADALRRTYPAWWIAAAPVEG